MTPQTHPDRPLIGIAPDVVEPKPGSIRGICPVTYADAVANAGGFPLVLPPIVELIPEQLERCHAIVLVGGDDPRTEPFGQPTHPGATPVHHTRQNYELALIQAIRDRDDPTPTLGICLGMQLMALHAGGELNQWMPDDTPSAEEHWDDRPHPVLPATEDQRWRGNVTSHHRQAVADPGCMRTLATAHDGIIEAIDDPDHDFYIGVQWHPERTPETALGLDIFKRLVEAARNH